jgi:glycosyltransferase involved in cell wall biosynthesis
LSGIEPKFFSDHFLEEIYKELKIKLNTSEVTVLIPNFKTLKLTRICLGLIQKFTDLKRIQVIVIDNDSRDESVEYLRTLSWITLVERGAEPDDSPALAHARALDMGLGLVETPFVLSMHTDTFVKHSGWLDILLGRMSASPDIAGVGSWKLENKPFFKRILKRIENRLEEACFKFTGKENNHLEGSGKNFFYLRSHCAMYRMDLISRYKLGFAGHGEVAGKMMHKKLVEMGYEMIFLSSQELSPYMVHLNHATMILNPALGIDRRSAVKGRRRFKKELRAMGADDILNIDELDLE